MTRTRKWLVGLGAVAVLLAVAAVVAWQMIPSDDELAEKAEQKLEQALGVKVTIGSLRWIAVPMPAVVLQDVATVQDNPLKARQITAYVHWRPLLDKVISIDSVEVDGVVVPQLSLKAFSDKDGNGRRDKDEGKVPAKKATPAASASSEASAGAPAASDGEKRWRMADVPLEHFHFTDLTWISRRGVPVVYEGEIDFDAGWRPRKLQVRRPGVSPRAQLTALRKGEADRWDIAATLAGGTLNGEVRLKETPGKLRLDGELLPKNIELEGAVRAFNRKPAIGGRASGSTVLESEGADVAELARSLHTRTRFTAAPASVLRFDLNKAIKTFGKEHDGQTPLESISGLMDTQNTGQGTVWTFSDLKATSGSLKASGNIVIFAGKVEAKGAVDLIDGLVGVPIVVTGELRKPDVSVPKGAIAGAAIGTAILPGIGTIIGARLGGLFGGAPDTPAAKPAASSAKKKTPPPGPRAR
ncbi:MAG: hypothetical protein EOO28_11720 [Comamonadaceae bacterium]|nr:MAG: hypothetical protein EOO28_11720 [Comamonadaceae bacterium]